MIVRCAFNRTVEHSRLASSSVSLGLVCALVLAPLSPAFGRQNAIFGSVSAVGAVRLRGVPVSGDGTLFAGDRIETAGDAYVKVQLREGPQLELGRDTDVRVDRGDARVQIAMNGGSLAFSSPRSSLPVRVLVESFRIEAPEGAAAEVAFLGPNRLSVTSLAESLQVTESTGQETEPVDEGEQVIIDLDAGVGATEPASSEAGADTDSGGSSAKWVLVGTAVGAGTGTVVLLTKKEKTPASRGQR